MTSGQANQDMQAAMNRLYYNFKLAMDHEGLNDDDAGKIIVAIMEATEVVEKLMNKKANKAKELRDDRR